MGWGFFFEIVDHAVRIAHSLYRMPCLELGFRHENGLIQSGVSPFNIPPYLGSAALFLADV